MGVEPSEFEESVAQALFDLENTNRELKSDLKDLFINSTVLRKAYCKIRLRLIRELEKKFSGKDIVSTKERFCCLVTPLHNALLKDVVYPAEIIGKHIRYRIDGSKLSRSQGVEQY